MPALTVLEEDALREIGEMGAGAAGAAIARMTGHRTTHVTSQLRVVPVADLDAALDVANGVSGAALRLEGDLRGTLLLAFPDPVAGKVAAALAGGTGGLDAMGRSTLTELANVATGAYLSTFQGFLGLDVAFRTPAFATGAWGPLARYAFLGNAPGSERAWIVASVVDTGLGEGRLFLLLDAKALERVLGAVHRRLHGGGAPATV